ncbi:MULTISPECIES: murein biosynthesis integral membrane protein MurJ [Deefgea]|uniref:Probable lipid II flippase MurJ n=1 Tax=Deefgea chitinilytica TaxID=570276 RepID=A0ABS2CF09_9NEIS|nr:MULTISPECIES: murein biosynthesis integral membrane protein MurJ [Deefgea]MBM5572726.1 murein biosynthesis integral membrane protein MurJ [Deefgea chitinilytica]MBM9889962.1 murein biosynthesis integral membrane protein MurJ [Deefgea sp. CFH1-16]
MNLLRSLAAVSSMTLVSRVLGFARDAIMATIFGAGAAMDAWVTAFRLPNLLRRIFAEGAFSQAFVPILADKKTIEGQEAAKAFTAHVAGLLTLILAIVTLVGILTAPWIIWSTAHGFTKNQSQFELTTGLLRITFPYILLISLSSLAGAVLNTWNKFSVPAFTPTLLNISFIIFALFFAPYFDPPIMAMAWALLVGGLAQLAYQLPHLKKIGMLVRPKLNLNDPAVWRVLKQMGPAILGVSVSQISQIINQSLASLLVVGSMSWIYYADRLMELPTGLLGVALGTILLPSLSKSLAKNDNDEYSKLLDWGLRLALLLALPSAVALAVIAEPLTISLFQYGKFTAHDAQMTQMALMAYAVGIPGLILIKPLAPAFYARKNIKTPVKIAVFSLLVTQGLNLILVPFLHHTGLALSISLAAIANAGLLYYQLRKQNLFIPQPGWTRFILKLLLAVVLMALSLYGVMQLMPSWGHGTMPIRLLRLSALVTVGLLVYFAILGLFGFRPHQFSRRSV